MQREADDISLATGSGRSGSNDGCLASSAARGRTTHRQFPTVGGGGSLMSVRDEKDSGYVGSTRSQQAALLQRPQRRVTSESSTANVAIRNRCKLLSL